MVMDDVWLCVVPRFFRLERWWDESNAYHVGTFEYFSSMFNGFKGTEGCTFTKMEKVSDSAVRFTLAQPYAPLLSTLAMFCFAIASPTAIKAQGPENYGTSPSTPA